MSLTDHEKEALRRHFLGGAEALRTATYCCACTTVQSLFRKRLLDLDGLTTKGKVLARQLAEDRHQRTTGEA